MACQDFSPIAPALAHIRDGKPRPASPIQKLWIITCGKRVAAPEGVTRRRD
jgi:hypothetical protein